MNSGFEYTIRRIEQFNMIVFDFASGHELLSGFLFTDSSLVFGKGFEQFDEIMKQENYSSAGNAYSIDIAPDSVTITFEIDDPYPSETLSREDFIRVMKEWIQENGKIENSRVLTDNERKNKGKSEKRKGTLSCFLRKLLK